MKVPKYRIDKRVHAETKSTNHCVEVWLYHVFVFEEEEAIYKEVGKFTSEYLAKKFTILKAREDLWREAPDVIWESFEDMVDVLDNEERYDTW